MTAFDQAWGSLRPHLIQKARGGIKAFPPERFEEVMRDYEANRGSIIPAPMKYTGSKAQPHYIGPLRRAMDLNPSKKTGGRRRMLEPFMGALNASANVNPGQRALVADYNRFMPEVFRRIQNNDMVLDMKPYMQDGVVPKQTYYESIRGAVPKGRRTREKDGFNSTWDTLMPNSFNDYLRREKEGEELSEQEMRDMLEQYARYQRMAWRGDARMPQGWANQTSNAPQFKFPAGSKIDYGVNAPVYRNFDIRSGMDFADFFKLGLDPDDDLLFLDSPYAGGEGANYDENMSWEQQELLAELAGEQAAEGMPVIATNNPIVRPLYEKHGFKTQLLGRPDRYRNYDQKQPLVKPEAIMHNLDDFDWFENHPDMKFASEDPFEQAWGLITKGKGKFKGYAKNTISDRPMRQGKAKAWGISRKVKRGRTARRYKRNKTRGNVRPAMRRQLGAGGKRQSTKR